MKCLATLASGLALALLPVPALAQPPAVTVHVSDLDLATPNGVARLDGRIDRAVARLCGTADPADLDGQAAVATCRAATMKSVSDRRAMLLARARAPGAIALGSTLQGR
ncbi:MAG TPA: UrcA family protein [Allosphingosinicella sp.]|nr:UrcA family protein [Allosphingosinicella sp.]